MLPPHIHCLKKCYKRRSKSSCHSILKHQLVLLYMTHDSINEQFQQFGEHNHIYFSMLNYPSLDNLNFFARVDHQEQQLPLSELLQFSVEHHNEIYYSYRYSNHLILLYRVVLHRHDFVLCYRYILDTCQLCRQYYNLVILTSVF